MQKLAHLMLLIIKKHLTNSKFFDAKTVIWTSVLTNQVFFFIMKMADCFHVIYVTLLHYRECGVWLSHQNVITFLAGSVAVLPFGTVRWLQAIG